MYYELKGWFPIDLSSMTGSPHIVHIQFVNSTAPNFREAKKMYRHAVKNWPNAKVTIIKIKYKRYKRLTTCLEWLC